MDGIRQVAIPGVTLVFENWGVKMGGGGNEVQTGF